MLARPVTRTGAPSLLDALRRTSERALLGMIALHGPALAAAAWLAGRPMGWPLSLWAALLAVSGAGLALRPGSPATRAVLAVSLCLMPALLVELLSGQPWQADAHMHFFAVLAATAILLDTGVILLAAAAIATHHLALNVLLPAAVFPGGGDLARVLFHAVILVFEAAALCWLADRTLRALSQSEAATREVARLAAEREREQAEAQLAAEAERRRAALGMAVELDRSLGGIATVLASSSQELSASADLLSGVAAHTSDQASHAAEESREASAGVQTVAAAAEEMTATVQEITRRVAETAGIVQAAVAEVQATDRVVRELADGASQIGEVVRLIGQIAGQTNLLALNATIEAARAGESGKGFAVVANEVKALAAQTARATEEIGQRIQQVQEATGRAVTAIRGIGCTVGRTSEVAAAIAAAVEQQGAATREISRVAQEVAVGTERMTVSVGEVSTAAAGTRQAVTGIRQSSGQVADQGTALRAELERVSSRLRRQGEAA